MSGRFNGLLQQEGELIVRTQAELLSATLLEHRPTQVGTRTWCSCGIRCPDYELWIAHMISLHNANIRTEEERIGGRRQQ